MAIRDRDDEPGAWHHVMNRGIARRTVFEQAGDVRRFQALLARTVRERLIEVHAFTFLASHFHLLLRSPQGRLSAAMCWAEREYVRWFNRTRRRDGPLFRSRFRSRRVEAGHDLRNVVHYIDQNPTEARIVDDAACYPFASSWHYQRSAGPPWMSRDVVEALVQLDCAADRYEPRLYPGVFGRHLTVRVQWLVERRLLSQSRQELVSLDLLKQAPPAVREWMRRKAQLADGTLPGMLVASPGDVLAELDRVALERPDWTVQLSYRKPALPILRAGLLRTACGLSLKEIALRLDLPAASVFKLVEYHARLLMHDPEYGLVAATCMRNASGAASDEM